MSDPAGNSLRELNDCGCCEGIVVQTPVEVSNRPGLDAVAYRTGTYTQFKQSMLARLSVAEYPALARLATRDDDDFSIALLDAWATVADVLTFYQERIANESYLRTATQRRSLVEMARLIGYRLAPGVAAGAYLAFTLDEAEGAPPSTTIGAGTKVQSTPGPGEQPQVFETVEEITARVSWNALRPRQSLPQVLTQDTRTIYLKGTTSDLNVGDTVLVEDADKKRIVRRVRQVTADNEADTTTVELETGMESADDVVSPRTDFVPGTVFVDPRPLTEKLIKSEILKKTWKSEDLLALADMQGWPVEDLAAGVNRLRRDQVADSGSGGFYAFRRRTSVFGYNAPRQPTYRANGTPNLPEDWVDWIPDASEQGNIIFLDNAYPEILPGKEPESFLVIRRPDDEQERVFRVDQATVHPRSAYGLNGQTTEIMLDRSWWDPLRMRPSFTRAPTDSSSGGVLDLPDVVFSGGSSPGLFGPGGLSEFGSSGGFTNPAASGSPFLSGFQISGLLADAMIAPEFANLFMPGVDELSVLRGTVVHAQSEPLDLAARPWEEAVEQHTVRLDGYYPYLRPGQRAALRGELADQPGVFKSEVLTLDQVTVEDGYTVLSFTTALAGRYVRSSVFINANVAPSTHGETVHEVLGSGDARQAYQPFILRQPPLTHVSAEAAGGTASTLQVRVNDVLWTETESLETHTEDDRVYVTRTADDGTTTVRFGDGIHGERLPTGENNIRATYRKGIGLGGLVKAGQLNMLMSRPLGVSQVTNPLAAAGAADPQPRDAARRNMPLTVTTLDRAVSLRDYEDYACRFAGIAKAAATWFWDGRQCGVLITVAGADGIAVPDEVVGNLVRSLRTFGDPFVRLHVVPYGPAYFRVDALLIINPDHDRAIVRAAVERALRDQFSFAARRFAQPVRQSEVIAVMQGVAGVMGIDVDRLLRSDGTPVDETLSLPAAPPRIGKDGMPLGAELLTLDPAPLELRVTP